eukprot:scaffold2678_cov123-Skeletonema_dohrnii-CCMP3373.AAC.5
MHVIVWRKVFFAGTCVCLVWRNILPTWLLWPTLLTPKKSVLQHWNWRHAEGRKGKVYPAFQLHFTYDRSHDLAHVLMRQNCKADLYVPLPQKGVHSLALNRKDSIHELSQLTDHVRGMSRKEKQYNLHGYDFMLHDMRARPPPVKGGSFWKCFIVLWLDAEY